VIVVKFKVVLVSFEYFANFDKSNLFRNILGRSGGLL
jgi:hypothetical protein